MVKFAQQCACTSCHWTVQLNMVKIVFLYHLTFTTVKTHFLKKVNEKTQGCAQGMSWWPRWLRRLWKEEPQPELGTCPWRPTTKSSSSFKDLEYGNSCIETNLNLALKPTGNRAELFVELCPRQAVVLPCASGWPGSLQHALWDGLRVPAKYILPSKWSWPWATLMTQKVKRGELSPYLVPTTWDPKKWEVGGEDLHKKWTCHMEPEKHSPGH